MKEELEAEMIGKQGNSGKPALATAMEYLAKRGRSCAEVRLRLIDKGFDEETAEGTVERLKEMRLLDDARFAAEWAESRLRRCIGGVRIRMELEDMGVDSETTHSALASLDKDEVAIYARKAAAKVAGRVIVDDPNSRPKAIRYVMSRGFSSSEAREAVSAVFSSLVTGN